MTLNPLTRRPLIAALLGLLLSLGMTVVVDTTVAPPTASAAVSKRCRQNSHTVRRTFVHEMPSSGGAGSVAHARGGNRPDYVIKGWFRWCYSAGIDGAHIWKLGVSARFPRGTDAAGLGFQGVFNRTTWFQSGGATRSVIKSAEGDAFMRKVVRVNVGCEDGVVSNPGFENSCSYRMRLKGAWSQIGDHEATRVGAFYYR